MNKSRRRIAHDPSIIYGKKLQSVTCTDSDLSSPWGKKGQIWKDLNLFTHHLRYSTVALNTLLHCRSMIKKVNQFVADLKCDR